MSAPNVVSSALLALLGLLPLYVNFELSELVGSLIGAALIYRSSWDALTA